MRNTDSRAGGGGQAALGGGRVDLGGVFRRCIGLGLGLGYIRSLNNHRGAHKALFTCVLNQKSTFSTVYTTRYIPLIRCMLGSRYE